MEEAGFDLTGMAWNEEVGFGLTGMAWKGESQFCPDRKAWNGGGQFWPDLNGLDWQMSVLADWFPQHLGASTRVRIRVRFPILFHEQFA
jgi:hypothetical protein